MNQPEKPSRRIDPPYDPQGIDATYAFGTVALVLGLVLCGGALVVGDGEPPWQVLGVFALVTVTGLALRLEAALQRK
ncbi:hypothetical protein ACIBG8_44220 [Nonomuraea sp. NPDC050556]|uniref:hypothetical protein n=1 Tax=Nonomuraea sp. NPDC050556 TaxID=3364369 RepID=UPI0037A4BE67